MRRSALDAWMREIDGVEPSRGAVARLQLERLNDLLARVRARGGRYAGLPPRLDSLEALASLPFTTADDLARRPGELLLLSQSRVDRVVSGATSGTTGPSKRLFYTARDLEHTVGFFAAGISEMDVAGTSVLIMMPFSGDGGLGSLIARAVERLGARPLRAGTEMTLGALCRLVRAERPRSAIAMPVPLLSLARWYAASIGEKFPIESGLISADACTPEIMRHLEGEGMILFPHYGSREICFGGAVTCSAHEGMHLREDHIIAEIVGPDGRPLPDGEWGELVLTTIDMEAMPLVRYRTGDRTRFFADPCRCGGATRRLDTVTRIGGDEMARADGALFSVPSLVDCSLERQAGSYLLRATTTGEPGEELRLRDAFAVAFSEASLSIEIRPASDDDRSAYAGKRHIVV